MTMWGKEHPSASQPKSMTAHAYLRALLLLILAGFAAAHNLHAQPLPKPVEKAVFADSRFAQSISVPAPLVTDPRTLEAFRRARPNSLGMSPIAPSGRIDRNDKTIQLYCQLHWIALDSVTTHEGITFEYAIAAPEFQSLGAHGSVPVARRKLKSIDYRNQYKANPLGTGERDVFAVTFSYTLESIQPGLQPPSTVFKGKATAQLDPNDGEWKLETLMLSDQGEQEIYTALDPQAILHCATASSQSSTSVKATTLATKAATLATFDPGYAISGRTVIFSYDPSAYGFRGSVTSVAVAGSFNGWSTQSPRWSASDEDHDGHWQLKADRSDVTCGSQFKFVVNGSSWQQPSRSWPASHLADDGHGGFNLVVVCN
ncbi:MAG TPA: glycogen-binding domain-containing protein [Thermoanaerobaculia bacterium]|nr:glycogen-binding domain-containing protein [Thermoanaerobaculia bacterium]